MNIFVSHAWEDKERLEALLVLPDFIHLWVDQNELAAGEALSETIRAQIDDSHIFFLIVSNFSITKQWVQKELDWALDIQELRNRPFILPIVVDEGIDLGDSPGGFSTLTDVLHIDATDTTKEGELRSQRNIELTIFHWLNDWLEHVEPNGNGNVHFIERLDTQFKEYLRHIYALKAALNWPISTLVKPDALKYLDEKKNQYNEFANRFLSRLSEWEDEVKWRYERHPYKQYVLLVAFVRDEIYHGAAYSLNDTINVINSYDKYLESGEVAVEAAEADRMKKIQSLDNKVEELTTRTAEFLALLKIE